MRVFLTGASGLLGGLLIDRLLARGDEIRSLSRQARAGRPGLSWVTGDVTAAGDWQRHVDGTDAVVHLAGESLADGRWTAKRKRELVDSRVQGTRNVVAAVAAAAARPRVVVAASGVHAYQARGEDELDESAALGTGFLAELCRAWEAETAAAGGHGARTVSLRMGVVLSARGGAMDKLRTAFSLFVGGPLGDSAAWFPWIHEEDAVGLMLLALDRELRGPVNAVAPGPVRMGDFARALGRALRRPAILPVPALALRLVLGEMATMVNPGLKVVPRAALAAGYRFAHPSLDGALASLSL
jgi:uncharacterized protein (TIGR01777 family)